MACRLSFEGAASALAAMDSRTAVAVGLFLRAVSMSVWEACGGSCVTEEETAFSVRERIAFWAFLVPNSRPSCWRFVRFVCGH